MERDSSMVQLFLIGISAGAATALLFASVASGSPLSVLLFYLAPLPILIAAIGWSHWAALIAAVVASAGLAIVFGPLLFLAFLLGVGLPAWWLGYLALLARPATASDAIEWYPAGHIVFWAAVLSALVVIAAMLNLGTDEESFRASLRRGLERAVRFRGSAVEQIPGVSNPDRLLDILVTVLPMAAAVVTTITNVVNVGIAARVVMVSGRLRRPWPELAAMRFPSYAPVVTGVAVAGFLLPGLVGIASGVLMASLLMAYAILGFAVLHAITRGAATRPFLLGGVYAAVIVFFWPALALTLLGLADTAFDIRGRVAGRRGPPHPGT
jgi:hypothetical protein